MQNPGMTADHEYRKRIFNFADFIRHCRALLSDVPVLFKPAEDRLVSSELEAKLMLAVTGVNDCVYCSWYHARRALKTGLHGDSVARLLRCELGRDVTDEETVALLYAQRYAESGGMPGPDETRRLLDTYGNEAAREIRLLDMRRSKEKKPSGLKDLLGRKK